MRHWWRYAQIGLLILAASMTLVGQLVSPTVAAASAARNAAPVTSPPPQTKVVNGITFTLVGTVGDKAQTVTQYVTLPAEACGQSAKSQAKPCTGKLVTTISAAIPVNVANSKGRSSPVTPYDPACANLSTTIKQTYDVLLTWHIEHSATFVWNNCWLVETTWHNCYQNNWIVGPGNSYNITNCEPAGPNKIEEDWTISNPFATFSYWQYILMDIYGNVWKAAKPY